MSNTELESFAQLRPDLAKQIALYKGLRTQRIQKEARAKGLLSARDPEKFIWDVLGWRPTIAAQGHGITKAITEDQRKVLHSLRDNRRTAVPSGNGAGKTRIAAAAVLWFLARYDDSIVITTASTWTLVEAQLWREIRACFMQAKVPLSGRLMQTELRIGDKHYAIGISTDDVSRFQGFHAPHVLVIIDEATGVREEIWEGAEAVTVGRDDRILALGNPTDAASRFARVCSSSLWSVVHIDCRSHPNVVYDDPAIIPGAVTKEWVDDKLEECGGQETHPLFQARVAGYFPTQGQDSIISLGDVEAAQQWDQRHGSLADYTDTDAVEAVVALQQGRVPGAPTAPREVTHQGKGVALGLDIAGPGSDLCCLWSISGGRAKLEWWTIHQEIMVTAGRVSRTIHDYGGRVKILWLDDTGIGNGVGSRLLELKRWEQDHLTMQGGAALTGHLAACAIRRCNFGESPSNTAKFWRLKDELWWDLGEALRRRGLGLPPEHELSAHELPKGNSLTIQLTTPIYELSSNGKIRVYDRRKPESPGTSNPRLRALPTKSPDLAHSLMLAYSAWKTLQAKETGEPEPKSIHEAIQRRFKDVVKKLMTVGNKKEEGEDADYEYL